ncbi:class I SAM-dependent methyltransferase [Dokdonia sp. Hel_I_53]|uniref:class I SAM-dependent methyltransferase n=1 Tax=Dokdonia sp. Hel_I_53 TaxID=1566287 RepID=UPI00119A8622|nr:class I SAM-dependent methyltransferase [Dokdonia sp. Hel_I_53]TVZ52650.1 methyltransferase family protein [Dokdonia sp. Hel_I_53]
MFKDIEVKDHSISQQTFVLRYDKDLHMYYTDPKPALKDLPNYYESEDYISHTDSKRSLFDIAYQSVKKISLIQKHKLLRSFHDEKGSVLDIGAGTGDFINYLSKKNWKVSGVEPNPKARLLAQKKGLQLQENLKDINSSFECITMWHVLEHVYDLENHIKWLKSHLKKNGTLFVAVPNFEAYDASYYNSYWAAFDVPRHLYHFSQKSVVKIFDKVGLEVVAIKPLKFDAYYVSLLSEKYLSKKINFLRAFKVATKSNLRARKSCGYSSQIYVIKHVKNQK